MSNCTIFFGGKHFFILSHDGLEGQIRLEVYNSIVSQLFDSRDSFTYLRFRDISGTIFQIFKIKIEEKR